MSVRMFVCPSVAYTANNSRTQRPSVRKFGRKVSHLWCDSRTSFQVKRSKVKLTRPINAHSLTHRVPCHIFRTARPTNFKLGIRMKDDDLHQPQAPWPPRSKVKVSMSLEQSELSWPNAVLVSLEADGGIPCRLNPAQAQAQRSCR